MNGTENEEPESTVVQNGTSSMVPSHSKSSAVTEHNSERLSEDQSSTHDDEPPVVQIEVGVAIGFHVLHANVPCLCSVIWMS